jgi:hypothetical protein
MEDEYKTRRERLVLEYIGQRLEEFEYHFHENHLMLYVPPATRWRERFFVVRRTLRQYFNVTVSYYIHRVQWLKQVEWRTTNQYPTIPWWIN